MIGALPPFPIDRVPRTTPPPPPSESLRTLDKDLHLGLSRLNHQNGRQSSRQTRAARRGKREASAPICGTSTERGRVDEVARGRGRAGEGLRSVVWVCTSPRVQLGHAPDDSVETRKGRESHGARAQSPTPRSSLAPRAPQLWHGRRFRPLCTPYTLVLQRPLPKQVRRSHS